jgi:hypothetical protein
MNTGSRPDIRARGASGHRRIWLWSALACVLVLSVPGCLLNRVITVKEQMCDFETNFVFRFDDTAELRFLHPILLDSDIVWLAGAEPSEIDAICH